MTLRSYEVTFKNGKSEVVKGKLFLFSENEAVVPVATNLNVYNANLVQSIKEVVNKDTNKEHFSCTYEGMKISGATLNIRSAIVENRINHLKDITPE
ncbi:hypothetical protein HWX41_07550 [Bacillus paramycoides]|uniref:hypothetical protein n=1 Tax=Bacillus paramycoides TaxID=2026194 RepID=UPI0015B9AE23|nr:hypothetical protein [Bacillus paramycoides]NWK68965.1 hypothetical protein [Bacillus paramycoides]